MLKTVSMLSSQNNHDGLDGSQLTQIVRFLIMLHYTSYAAMQQRPRALNPRNIHPFNY
jgi:hypothetical protein